jgi:LysM repeat protein
MSRKLLLIIALALTAILLLAACERSASQAPQATPTIDSLSALSQPTGSISLVEAFGTSTAIYEQTALASGQPTATPDPNVTPVATNTTSTQVPPTGSATTPIATVAVATPGRPASYTLQVGEFPYCIARRFNVDPQALLALNSLSDGQILQPGKQLNIPQTGNFPGQRPLHAHPATYTVQVDDNIYRIACFYGDIDPTAIAAANGLTSPYTLTTGSVLNIP